MPAQRSDGRLRHGNAADGEALVVEGVEGAGQLLRAVQRGVELRADGHPERSGAVFGRFQLAENAGRADLEVVVLLIVGACGLPVLTMSKNIL